jgi:hypothetical protein
MEYAALTEKLELAKRRAKLGQEQVDHQQMVIATLFASGSEITEAENRLRVLQRLESIYRADLDRLLNGVPRGARLRGF